MARFATIEASAATLRLAWRRATRIHWSSRRVSRHGRFGLHSILTRRLTYRHFATCNDSSDVNSFRRQLLHRLLQLSRALDALRIGGRGILGEQQTNRRHSPNEALIQDSVAIIASQISHRLPQKTLETIGEDLPRFGVLHHA